MDKEEAGLLGTIAAMLWSSRPPVRSMDSSNFRDPKPSIFEALLMLRSISLRWHCPPPRNLEQTPNAWGEPWREPWGAFGEKMTWRCFFMFFSPVGPYRFLGSVWYNPNSKSSICSILGYHRDPFSSIWDRVKDFIVKNLYQMGHGLFSFFFLNQWFSCFIIVPGKSDDRAAKTPLVVSGS